MRGYCVSRGEAWARLTQDEISAKFKAVFELNKSKEGVWKNNCKMWISGSVQFQEHSAPLFEA
jgi:hypothetical protein